MFTAPDKNIKASLYPDKTIFESLRGSREDLLCSLETSHPSWSSFSKGSLAFPAYRPLCGHPEESRSLAPRLQEKLTFKPAIKKEKCEIFDFSGASYPRRQLVDAYNPRGNLISLISQAKHVRTSPPFRNLRFSCICHRHRGEEITGKYPWISFVEF